MRVLGAKRTHQVFRRPCGVGGQSRGLPGVLVYQLLGLAPLFWGWNPGLLQPSVGLC